MGRWGVLGGDGNRVSTLFLARSVPSCWRVRFVGGGGGCGVDACSYSDHLADVIHHMPLHLPKTDLQYGCTDLLN